MDPRDEEQVAEFETNVTAFYSNPNENSRLHSWIMNYHLRQGSLLLISRRSQSFAASAAGLSTGVLDLRCTWYVIWLP